MRKLAKDDEAWKEFFVAETLDTGFRNLDVYRTLQKVTERRRGVRGMEAVFRKHLTVEGQIYAMKYCDIWIRDGWFGWKCYLLSKK